MIPAGRKICHSLAYTISVVMLFVVTVTAAQSGIHNLADGCLVLTPDGSASMFASDDGGRLWRQLEDLPRGVRYGFFPHPRGGAWLALSTGLHWSDSGTENWQLITTQPVAWVYASESGSSTLFKIWGRGLFLAAGAGLHPSVDMSSHQQIALPLEAPIQAAVVTNNGLYTGFFGHGVYFLDPEQGVWLDFSEGLTNKDLLTLVPGSGGQLFAGTLGGGLLRLGPSETPVSRWALADPVFTGWIVDQIDVSPDGIVLASSPEATAAVSFDGGFTWSELEWHDEWDSGVRLSAASVDRWWALTRTGNLFGSRTYGEVWLAQPYAFTQRIQQVAVDGTGRIWAAVTGSGVFASRDYGETWAAVALPEAWSSDNKLAAAEEGMYYAAMSSSSLWLLPEGEQDWQEVANFWGDIPLFGIASDVDGRLYLLTRKEGGLYIREEGEWRGIQAEAPTEHRYMVRSMMFHPNYTLALGAYQLLMQSHKDGNGSWSSHPFGQMERRVFFDENGRLVTERQMSTFVWDASAGRWELENSAAGEDEYRWFEAGDSDQIVAASRTGVVALLNEDNSVGRSLLHLEGEVLDMTGSAGLLLIGTTQGMHISQDGGQSWKHRLPGILLP